MELPLNKNRPMIMHIDLNSCFATIEQQANPFLRGKPLVVAAYETPNACIVAPSVEAKRYGIKTGMRIRDARLLCNDIIVRTPDPSKYRDVHTKFKKIFMDYSDKVTPKSIDEAIVDFRGFEGTKIDLISIGKEIKQRMKDEIGEWIRCSIGIGTNRFLAKTGASLHKPDGLDLINHESIKDVYSNLKLIDLCGINVKYQARLNAHGIFTPTDFLNAPCDKLQSVVFKSVVGRWWYERLRGHEVDDIEYETKSIGQQYAIKIPTNDKKELASFLMKLSEKMGRRLRRQGYIARGVHVACVYNDWTYWHQGRLMDQELYTTQELYKCVWLVFNRQPQFKPVSKISVSCYGLEKSDTPQLSLFEMNDYKARKASDAMDEINDRFGEFIITPGIMMGMEDLILDRIAFGGVKELEDLYLQK